jgi:DNA modification methylase
VDESRIIHGNALDLPLEDASVDLIVTSPPYFALRSYRDGDEHYGGQIGSEATPAEFLDALWAATAEMVRVLKPTGSIWVNLGDKYAGSGGHNNNGVAKPHTGGLRGIGKGYLDETARAQPATRRDAPDRYNQDSGGIPAKSLMGLPWRYAIGCIDRLGLILRAEVIWSKPNGLPESVTDRVRRSHEQWFHFVKQGRYFSAVDEVREAHADRRDLNGVKDREDYEWNRDESGQARQWEPKGERVYNPLGKLPGSVWTIPSEPLIIPDVVRDRYGLPDHFAAFPQEWPRRIILGWSPAGICVACGEGRRPVVEKELRVLHTQANNRFVSDLRTDMNPRTDGLHGPTRDVGINEATITGYACACTPYTDHPPPTKPSVILDPFAGTGTVVLVARALGRIGIGIELSRDYCRLAEWRVFHSGAGEKAERRTWAERQLGLL